MNGLRGRQRAKGERLDVVKGAKRPFSPFRQNPVTRQVKRMYSEAAIADVKARALPLELQPANERNKGKSRIYICPSCGHARVVNPTAAGIWYCQRCYAKGDVFTAVRLRDNVEHAQAFADVMRRYAGGGEVSAAVQPVKPSARPSTVTTSAAWAKQCGEYLRGCSAALPGSPGEMYMRGRGFTLDTLTRFGVGYDAKARIHGALKYPRQAVVYPYSRRLDYYGARFITPMKGDNGEVKAMKPPISKAGNEPLFNGAALYGCEAVFICEGAFDAMAIMQGANALDVANVGAVALGGTGGGRLLDALTNRPTGARLLICLDNDEPGKTGALALAAKLDNLGVDSVVIDSEAAFAGMKDAGDLLRLEPSVMPDAVQFMLYDAAARL